MKTILFSIFIIFLCTSLVIAQEDTKTSIEVEILPQGGQKVSLQGSETAWADFEESIQLDAGKKQIILFVSETPASSIAEFLKKKDIKVFKNAIIILKTPLAIFRLLATDINETIINISPGKLELILPKSKVLEIKDSIQSDQEKKQCFLYMKEGEFINLTEFVKNRGTTLAYGWEVLVYSPFLSLKFERDIDPSLVGIKIGKNKIRAEIPQGWWTFTLSTGETIQPVTANKLGRKRRPEGFDYINLMETYTKQNVHQKKPGQS